MKAAVDARFTETETTLRLIAGWRQTTLHELQSLDRIGDYRLIHRLRTTVRDRYLDTPGMKLRRSRFALRIRKSARETWMTLKGPSTRNPDGSRSRLEIERPWNAKNGARMFRELDARGVRLRGDWDRGKPPSRKALLAGAGLKPFQERIMIRDTRDVVLESGGPEPFAEMVVDQVAYSPGGEECRHAEMELELKPGADPALLEPVGRLFLERFEERLELWLHGKLAIGLALEELMDGGPEPGLLDTHRWLTEPAYRRIQELLLR